jgi:hypothetical protein
MKILKLLILSLIMLLAYQANAAPPVQETYSRNSINEFKQMVNKLNAVELVSPLLIYFGENDDIYIFENFVKWEKMALATNRAGGARALEGTGEFVSTPTNSSFRAPIIFNHYYQAGDFLKTGNFGIVLYHEIKEDGLRQKTISDIEKKIRHRNEAEKAYYEHLRKKGLGEVTVAPEPIDMRSYLISASQRQTMDGIPTNIKLLKWIKNIVFFDFQANQMIALMELYIDSNGERIAWAEFQDVIDLDKSPMYNKIGRDILAILKESNTSTNTPLGVLRSIFAR